MKAGWATCNDRFDLTPLPHAELNSFAPRSVKLPRLRELTLREPLPITLAIFAHLEVPPSAQLELRGFYRDISDPNSLANSLRALDEALGPHLLSTYSEVATDGFTTLKLKAFDNIGDTGFDTVFEGAASSSSSGPRRFVFGTMGLFMPLFGRVLSWPPMTAHVRRLELSHADSDVPEGAQIWEHLLGHLPNLEEVYFSAGHDVARFIECLRAQPGPLLLRKLVFEDAILPDAVLDVLMEALSLRDAASPMVDVSMIRCDVSESKVYDLMDHERVGEVEWDDEDDGVTRRDVAFRASFSNYTASGMPGALESTIRSRERVAEVVSVEDEDDDEDDDEEGLW